MLLQQVTLTFYNNKLISNERVVQGFQAMACFYSQVPFHICYPKPALYAQKSLRIQVLILA